MGSEAGGSGPEAWPLAPAMATSSWPVEGATLQGCRGREQR